jgi:O-antigen/teichoic acid export membrane protein
MIRKQRSPQRSSIVFIQSTGAKLLVIGVNAATGIFSARALRASGRGELAAMILWNVLLANAFTFGIPSALTFQLQRHLHKRSELVGAAFLIGLITSVLAMFAGLLGMKHWIPQYSPQVIAYSCLFLLNIPIFAWSLIGRAALEGGGDFKTSNTSLTLAPLMTLIGLLALLWSHTFTPVAAAWVYVLMGLPSFLLITWRIMQEYRPSLRNARESVQLLLSYGVRSYGVDLCGTMAFYVDQALVIHLLNPGMMGAYVVALSLSRMLNAFHTAVVMVLFPRIASQSTPVILELTGQAVRITTLLTVSSGLLVAAFGPWLLGLLYGKEYRNASGVVRILVIEVVLSGIAQVLSQAFMALGRPGFVTGLQIIGLSLTVPLMLLFIPRFGVVGAAAALLISTTVRLLFVAVSFQKILKVDCPRIVVGRADISKIITTISSLRTLPPHKPDASKERLAQVSEGILGNMSESSPFLDV